MALQKQLRLMADSLDNIPQNEGVFAKVWDGDEYDTWPQLIKDWYNNTPNIKRIGCIAWFPTEVDHTPIWENGLQTNTFYQCHEINTGDGGHFRIYYNS